jgi:hypothetical protein
MKQKAFQDLTYKLARGRNHNITTIEILNTRLLSSTNPFVVPNLHSKDLSKESILAPVIVTTNVRKLALCNTGAAAISKASGHPLYVIYAHMQRTILGDAALFRRLCFYPQKVLPDSILIS